MRPDHSRRHRLRRHRRAALHRRRRRDRRPHRRGRRSRRRHAPIARSSRPARRSPPASSMPTRTTIAPCCAGPNACCARCRKASPPSSSAIAASRYRPSRMRTRPVPPLDLLGDESWWTFDSFAAYAERLARDPSPVNTYALIGHMSLRVEAMHGDTQRAATDKEAAHMQRRLAEALAQGASGFSTGLYYPPNMHGADRRGDRRRRSPARRRRHLRLAHARRGQRRTAVDRGDLADRPRGERSGGDQPPQMRHAGKLRPLDRNFATHRSRRAAAAGGVRRLSLSRRLHGADAAAAAAGCAGAGDLVGAASRSRRPNARRHRARLEHHAARSRRTIAPRRRDLLPDG